MSRAVKDIVMRNYRERIGDRDDAVVVNFRGVNAIATNKIRKGLLDKGVRVTLIRNNLFVKAFEGRGLANLKPVLSGSNAVVYGGESAVDVAREIVGLLKDFPDIELKGAVLDGMLFNGADGVKELSKFPTREEAIARNITLIVSPGRKLLGAVKGPGGRLLGIVKAIEEKLEKGETIAKVG